ncbi:dimethylaniline monooxygenase 2 [Dothidotthia symphoricarpi CBS 119687]|uniref:Dimethylaniline monooxygenase 2 n=1 Tax=Dothidotthia symphoricarpi CBS 119687 TaxID=1392245 RepID=A0A6A6A8H0_9PLEO|nr:dimethylaniline monooxygenase 2 [Dothidotthia symphoricarpi CBS 119687]KAF2128140.1 dimethylaniline monooxygenase 2 [Dothidotthia symphoricarpi CBS 119687]
MTTQKTTVAVIGLGSAGLAALKNLTEEGFEVTGFERNSYVGGLWQYTEEDKTSVLETTTVNISKERGCFTDFPFPQDVSSFPTGAQVATYLTTYCEHFNLQPRIRLNTTIRRFTYDDDRQKWVVGLEGESEEFFDKVVIAIGGVTSLPNLPLIEGTEKFGGVSVHSRAFKRPGNFKGKRVMVVGFGNTAVDTATQLAGVAEKVYLAHRHGAHVLPHLVNGRPIDHTHTLRLFSIQNFIIGYFPKLGSIIFAKLLKDFQEKCFTIRPEWGFEPAQASPVVSDNLVPCLEKGTIDSVKGIRRILSETQVELEDGRKVDVDAIIWCTGYKSDFSMLEPRFDPTTHSTPTWSTASGSNGKSLARLYHNIFSLEKPDSLAFLGNVQIPLGGFQVFDMASMAIAQVWKGATSLPSLSVMNQAVGEHHAWLADCAQRSTNVSPGMVNPGSWIHAMDEMAGTGVNEYLGYGWKGWSFWFQERKFCGLLMDGIWSPHIHRVFQGKRKLWNGASDAIKEVNESATATKDKQMPFKDKKKQI